MKKLLLLATAVLTSLSLCANTILPFTQEIKAEKQSFTQTKTSLKKSRPLMLSEAKGSNTFTFDAAEHGRKVMPSRAGETATMPFAYAGAPYSLNVIQSLGSGTNSVNIAAGTRVYLALGMLSGDIQVLAGNKVSEVTLVTSASNDISTNPIPEVEFFITTGFGEPILYRQTMNLGEEAFKEVTIPLTTPYVIPDDQEYIFFGYSFVVPQGDNYWLPYDLINPPTNFAGLIAATNDEALVTDMGQTSPENWSSFTSLCGSLCMYLTIEGDNLPKNLLSPVTFQSSSYTTPGEDSELLIVFDNKGSNDIEEIGISASVNGGATSSITSASIIDYNTDEKAAIKPGGTGIALFNIPVPADANGSMNIAFTIDRINNEQKEVIKGEYQTLSYNNGYDRTVVFEDATGTWCGWCPAGIYMLEYLKENYPEALLIGVHASNGGTTDPMNITQYINALNVSGFPKIFINRNEEFSPGGRDENNLKIFADEYMRFMTSYPSYGKIEFTSSIRSSSTLNISATVNFSIDLASPHSVSLVTIQDKVGPYDQTNYYNGINTALGTWNTAGELVSTIFDDVARGFKLGRAFAQEVKKDENYTVTNTVSYSKVDATKPHRVAALLINDTTGEIVNAAVIDCLEGDSAGIEDVVAGDSNADITIGAGSITVEGARVVSVYSLDGRKVADGNATGLAAGIYIVVADGNSTKVAVY